MAAKDSELDNMLEKAAREDASPAQSIILAVRDPAAMRKLVRQGR